MKYLIHLEMAVNADPKQLHEALSTGLTDANYPPGHMTVETHTREGQDSCYQWCRETFPRDIDPNQERLTRLKAVLEETIELCIAGGLTVFHVENNVNATLDRLKFEKPSRVAEESADVQLALYALAGHDKFRLQEAVDEKMRLNRSRPQEYYDQKQALKRLRGER